METSEPKAIDTYGSPPTGGSWLPYFAPAKTFKNQGDHETFSKLRKIAWFCGITQFFAIFVYLVASIVVPGSEETAVACGIFAIILSIAPIFYAVRIRRFSLVFSCIGAFSIAPIWFLYLESVLPGSHAFEFTQPEFRMKAFFWIAIFQFLVNILYIAFWRPAGMYAIKSFAFLKGESFKPNFFSKLTIIAFCAPLVAFYFFYGSAETLFWVMTAGRSEGGFGLMMNNGSVGDSSSLMLPLAWLWQLTPLMGSIAFIAAQNKRYRVFPLLSLLLGLIVIFVFFLTGSRGTMMSVAAPALFFVFYYNWHRGLKFWISAAAIFFLVIGIMEMQVRFRGNLLNVIANPTAAARENGLESVTTFDPTKAGRDNNLYLFCLMIENYPAKYGYEGFNDFFAVILNPIPRVVWPNKPILHGAMDISDQQAFVLEGPLFMGTTSLSYSIVGEAYQADGPWGLLFYAMVYALLLIFFDGIIYHVEKERPVTIGILGMNMFLSFWGFRSFFGLVTFLYPLILFLVILRLLAASNRSGLSRSFHGKNRVSFNLL